MDSISPTELPLINIMKNYHLYVFTQDACPPCIRLKNFVATLPESDQAEIDYVPMKTPSGQRTALAEELGVELTPTLVVVHEDIFCELDPDSEDEFCDRVAEPVERYVGGNNIIANLDTIIDAYTYAHPE